VRLALNPNGAALRNYYVRQMGIPVSSLSDEALLEGYASGDKELAVAFIRRFQSRVYGVALAVLGDPAGAEDVAQQAFERAWRHGSTYDARRGSVGTWLAAITRNLAIDTTRVRKADPVEVDALLAALPAGPNEPEAKALDAEASREIMRALRLLPNEQARAIVLAGMLGMSASQVAAAEAIPLGTAKTRIRTAMSRLRGSLREGHLTGLAND
jgi:RNA polymerase sigma-70 factor (ECF subfamily)